MSILKKYLEDNGIKQSAFAKQVGISRQLLSAHLKDTKMPWSIKNAEKIHKVSGIDIVSLIAPAHERSQG